jgi:hypothetical protein
LVAKAPFHCNEQYPYKITLDRAPGVTFPNPIARGMRVNGTRATLSVPFSADSAGQFVISGTFAFSTCSADRCLIDKAKLSVPIDVR